jgi:hypothetical protein
MGYFGKALAISGSATIDGIPAWEFMNQTGTLGTYLAGSAIYVGDSTGAQTAVVIVAGTLGAQNTVVSLSLNDGGTGYTGAVGVATTTDGNGSGLTVTTVVGGGAPGPITAGTIVAAGTGYKLNDTITISGGGGNATFNVDDVRSLLPVAGDAVTFDDVQAGSVLPVYVDYVLNTSTAGGFIAMRNET